MLSQSRPYWRKPYRGSFNVIYSWDIKSRWRKNFRLLQHNSFGYICEGSTKLLFNNHTLINFRYRFPVCCEWAFDFKLSDFLKSNVFTSLLRVSWHYDITWCWPLLRRSACNYNNHSSTIHIKRTGIIRITQRTQWLREVGAKGGGIYHGRHFPEKAFQGRKKLGPFKIIYMVYSSQ